MRTSGSHRSSAIDATTRVAIGAERVEREAWLDFFEAAPPSVRKDLALANAVVAGIGLLASRGAPITEFNRAMSVGVEEPPTAAELDAVAAWLDANTHGDWALQIPPFAHDAGLRDLLRRRGYEARGTGWAKFVREKPAREETRRLPNGLTVRMADVREATDFGRTVQAGFGLPVQTSEWFASLVGRPDWRCYLAFVDGAAAAGGALYASGTSGWLGMGTTLAAYRGRGAQRFLIDQRVRDADAHGIEVLTAETAQPGTRDEPGFESFRNCCRAGFTPLYARPNFRRTAVRPAPD